MISFWEKQPRSKQPKCQSYENVKVAVNYNLPVVKLELFAYVASILEPFLKSCQSDNPMLPFLYFDLKSLLSTLLKLFIKPSVIAAAKTGSSVINIDISKISNQILNKDLGFGFAAKVKLKELRSKDLVSVSQEVKFREEAKTFLTHLVSKLFERALLDSVVVRPVSIFHPKIVIEYSCEKMEKILRKLLHHLMSLNVISAPKCNKTVQQLTFHKRVKSSADKFTYFSRSNDSLD